MGVPSGESEEEEGTRAEGGAGICCRGLIAGASWGAGVLQWKDCRGEGRVSGDERLEEGCGGIVEGKPQVECEQCDRDVP